MMRILFFAQLKDVTGRAELEWPEAAAMSPAQLWDRLEQLWPAISVHRPATRLARNGEYVGGDTLLEPGDEVALIPPVSGG
ncbi:MAG: MoaD/ThiS family protein [Verrucomicrobia bacterium]|nr:MAG: MoaD/ThiS family protein [Verrucomicrobiota bacterium]